MNKVNRVLSRILVVLTILCFIVFFWTKPTGIIHTTSTEPADPTSAPTLEPTVAEKKLTIGWSVYTTDFEYFISMQEGVLAKAKELGMDVITHNQNRSVAEMISGNANLIKQGIDALVISPFEPEAMLVISDLANEAGIPLIVIDQGYDGADIDAFIISDSFGGGILAGEYALKLIKEKSINSKNAAIIKVEERYPYARLRGEGFKRVMNENDYTIVAEVIGNSIESDAYAAMKHILETYSDDLAVVFCETDRMAIGAAKAIDEAGKRGKIKVIGFDGDPAAITAIKDGLMQGTVAQQPYEMGELGVEVAYKMLNGLRVSYDDYIKKEMLMEVYLVDENGTAIKH